MAKTVVGLMDNIDDARRDVSHIHPLFYSALAA